MGKKVEHAVCVFGSAFLLEQVITLQNEIENANDPKDIEPIHQMRVASRRLRTGFEYFGNCLPEKKSQEWVEDIRRITRALGQARDLDIQIKTLSDLYDETLDEKYKPGYRRLLLRLKQRRVKAQKKVTNTLDEYQGKDILNKMRGRLEKLSSGAEELYLYIPSLYQRAFSAIKSDLDAFLSYEKFIHEPDNSEKLHAMRIAGKHLRYSLEIFAPIYKEALFPHIQIMKDIQDELGAMHDDDVWVNWLPKFIQQEEERVVDYFGNKGPLKRLLPGFNYLIEDRKKSRDLAYQSFLSIWETLTYENAWENLEEIIKAPINIEAAMAFLSDEEEKTTDKTFEAPAKEMQGNPSAAKSDAANIEENRTFPEDENPQD